MKKILWWIIVLVVLAGVVAYIARYADVFQQPQEDAGMETPTMNTLTLGEVTRGTTATAVQATLSQPGYIVIFKYDKEQGVTPLGASALLPAGEHNNVAIELNSEVQAGDGLWAVLYADNGDGTFSPADDQPLMEDGKEVADVDVVDAPEGAGEEELAEALEEFFDAGSGESGEGDSMDAAVNVTLTAKNFSFSEPSITVKEGQTVRLTLTSEEGLHDFVIDEITGAKTNQLKTGESEAIEFVADKKGTYAYYCSVGDHRERGMEGILIVE